MACHDCNDCSKSIYNGGKCTRLEYDCPFSVFDGQTKEDGEKLKEVFALLQKAKEIMDSTDEAKWDCEHGVAMLNNCIDEFEDYVSEDMRKEWESIQ